jgi:histidine ammonia-lyase
MEDSDLTLSVHPEKKGIAMINGSDEMAGILMGMRCRRIVACVNACKGLSTEELEAIVADRE